MIRQLSFRYWILFWPKAKNWAWRGTVKPERRDRTEKSLRMPLAHRIADAGPAWFFLHVKLFALFILSVLSSPSNGPDQVALGDAGQWTGITYRAPEDGVGAVQVWLGSEGDEPLTGAGIRAGEGHAQRRLVTVTHPIDLVTDRSPWSAETVSPRIAILHDESRYHPVPTV